MKRKFFGLVLLLFVFAACDEQEAQEQHVLEIEEVEEIVETEEIEEAEMAWSLSGLSAANFPLIIEPGAGLIFLYGEFHNNAAMTNKQFERWYYYYHNHGMRHMIMEACYAVAGLLNIWMQRDSDEILHMLFDEPERRTGRDFSVSRQIMFRFKNYTPETVFHGMDIPFDPETITQYFLRHLREEGLEGSEQYLRVLENLEQRERVFAGFETGFNQGLRADIMAQNFVPLFDALEGESVMSLFWGDAHVQFGYYGQWFTGANWRDAGATVASQLKEIYGDGLHTTSLPALLDSPRGLPLRIEIAGQSYSAEYFYKEDMEFWRIVNAWADFAANELTGHVLLHSDFPAHVRPGDVFKIVAAMPDGQRATHFFRTYEGFIWDGAPAMVEFLIE